jgi:hypothetical protein
MAYKYAGVMVNSKDVFGTDVDGVPVIFRRIAEIVVRIAGAILERD